MLKHYTTTVHCLLRLLRGFDGILDDFEGGTVTLRDGLNNARKVTRGKRVCLGIGLSPQCPLQPLHIYIYIYVCVCACAYIHTYIIHTYRHTYIYIYTEANECAWASASGHSARSSPYACAYIHTYILHTHIHAYIYTPTYIYTSIHTHITHICIYMHTSYIPPGHKLGLEVGPSYQ